MLDVDALQQVGHESCIAPCLWVTYLVGLREHVAVFLQGRVGELVVVRTDASYRYLYQLVDGEVGKLELVGETRLQTGIGSQQLEHGVLVAAEHDGNVALGLVGQDVHEQLDDNLTRIVIVLAVEQISLVNHQNTTFSHLKSLSHSALLVAPKRTDEGSAIADHYMAFRQCTCLMQQRAVNLADSGLSSTRSTEEDAV